MRLWAAMNKYLYNLFFLSMLIHSVSTLYSLGNDAFGEEMQFAIPSYCELIMESIAFYYMLSNIRYILKGSLKIRIFLWLCYVTISVLLFSNGKTMLFDLRQVVMWGSVFFMGYIVAKDNPEYVVRFRKLIMIFLPVFVFIFYFISQFRTFGINQDGVIASNNTIYFILMLLPVLQLAESKKVQLILLALITLCVLYSMKRTAIIATVMCVLAYVYYSWLKHNRDIMKKAMVVLAAGSTAYGLYSMLDGSYLFSRFESIQEDKGSNRLDIYSVVWDKIVVSSDSEILFGHGFNAVMRNNASGENQSAHNDFLEILYDYGLFGLMLYLSIIAAVVRLALRVKRERRFSDLFLPMAMSVFILLIVSMFSHLAIYPMYYIYLTCFWGIVVGTIHYRRVRLAMPD